MKFNELKKFKGKEVVIYLSGNPTAISGTLEMSSNKRKKVTVRHTKGGCAIIEITAICAITEEVRFKWNLSPAATEEEKILANMEQKATENIQKQEDEEAFKSLDKTIEEINKKYIDHTYKYPYYNPYTYTPIQMPYVPYTYQGITQPINTPTYTIPANTTFTINGIDTDNSISMTGYTISGATSSLSDRPSNCWGNISGLTGSNNTTFKFSDGYNL